MRLALLLHNLGRGGGQIVAATHAGAMAATGRHEVFLVAGSEPLEIADQCHPAVRVVLRETAPDLPKMDLVLTTWWETGQWATEVDSWAYGQFMQSVEDRFYQPFHRLLRRQCLTMQTMGAPTITESAWIVDWLARVAPGQPCYQVRNGVPKADFPPTPPRTRPPGQPLRVVVEGSSAWFKHTRETLEGVLSATVPIEVDYVAAWSDWVDDGLEDALPGNVAAYRRHSNLTHPEFAGLLRGSDIFVKLPFVEGMPGPPLEAMHCGAFVIATAVKGIEEYAVHGWNCALVNFDDQAAVGKWIDLLWSRPALMDRVRDNAYRTALAWPSTEESGGLFERAAEHVRDHGYDPRSTRPARPGQSEDLVGIWDEPAAMVAPVGLDAEAAIPLLGVPT
jgi:O-antigen biosynthesis protein